ncbi:MAG: histidine triad nucleotide-binding protein [Pseudohongiellaceae bacterium]
MSSDCLFCKIISGEIPSQKVFEDEELYAFRDIQPAAPHHILVIPKKHMESVAAAQQEDAGLLGRLLLRANEIALQEHLAESGFRYVINTGKQGGQSVFHLHLHILGGRQMQWPPG